MKAEAIDETLAILLAAFENQTLAKMKISGPKNSKYEFKDVSIRLITINKGPVLQFVYNYPNKNITKNYLWEESAIELKTTLEDFKNVSIITLDWIHQYNENKGKYFRTKNKQAVLINTGHNKVKSHLLDPQAEFLKRLDITNASGNVKAGKGPKLKQINKYVEIMAGLVKEAQLPASFSLVDMGSGKGYLTFALYDYLSKMDSHTAKVTGIELRPDLVEKCNNIAAACNYMGLDFVEGRIDNYQPVKGPDALVALHACDTATDDAIAIGIQSAAKLIVCSPCCHKQIRNQMAQDIKLKSLTKFGILKERQAELVTDTLRALILELHGYSTKVMEFISSEHTAKNLLIVAIKKSTPVNKDNLIAEIELIKNEFGISYHYLEKTLKINEASA